MKTNKQHALAEACNAQTLVIEGIENLAAYELEHLEEADALFHTAMGKLVSARAAVREAIRERDGLQTIASTRRAG